MKLNKDYLHFKRWFKGMELTFHQSQYSDEDIAYSAFNEGLKIGKTELKNFVIWLKNQHYSVRNTLDTSSIVYLYLKDK